MLLDLSEIFVCPRCRPAQGLVVLVDEIDERRVVRGYLGCPECEARFPVEAGTVRFDGPGSGSDGTETDRTGRPTAGSAEASAERGDAAPPAPDAAVRWADAALFDGTSRQEAALRTAALLGLPEAEGPFLLGPGLDGLAVALAGAAEDEEVLSVGAAGARDPGDGAPAPGAGAVAGGRGGEAPAGDGEGEDGDAPRRVTRLVGVPESDWPVFPGRLGGVVLLAASAGAVEEAVRSLREGGRVVVVEPDAGGADVAEGLPVEVTARDARALVGVRRI